MSLKSFDDVLVLLDLPITREVLEEYIHEAWVKPREEQGGYWFEEVDVARIRLVYDLDQNLQVGKEALPVVLDLIDQLHTTRASMRKMVEAIERQPRRVQAEIFSLMMEDTIQPEE